MNPAGSPQAAKVQALADDRMHPEHDEESIESCRHALAQDPNSAEAYLTLGSIYQDKGWMEKAAVCYRQAMAIAPQDERCSFSLGCVLQAQGRFDEAAECYGRTLSIRPDCAPAYYNLGLLHLARQRHEQAAAVLDKAVALQPRFAAALNNLGTALMALGRLDRARDCFQAALEADPVYAEAHGNLGRLMFACDRWDEALASFLKAIALKPAAAELFHNIGLCHHKLRRLDEAESWYRRALAQRSDDPRIQIDMGNIFLDRGDLDEMIAWYRKAAAQVPQKTAAMLNVSRMLQDQGRWTESLRCCEEALARDPLHAEARFDRSLLLLRLGRLEEGWKEYEWRFQRANRHNAYPHRLTSARWDGSEFHGRTILIHCEQGFGDTLQFARYLPKVKQRGGTVIFETQAQLCSLFQGFRGADEVVALSADGPIERPHDCHIPLLSLPGIFGTTTETIPVCRPYVSADPFKEAFWTTRLGVGGMRVGIVWAGSAWHGKDRKRSCGIAPFLALARIPGLRLIGLQKGAAAAEALNPTPGLGFSNFGGDLNDFSDTAALVSVLDLVISVDTAVAHLAGAMGKPVWVLLPLVCDWRWLTDRQDSPWYPSMRLFRQGRGETWPDVFHRVAAALRDLAEDRERLAATRDGA
jgi:tetratricopeptide (TPR) repeat protein